MRPRTGVIDWESVRVCVCLNPTRHCVRFRWLEGVRDHLRDGIIPAGSNNNVSVCVCVCVCMCVYVCICVCVCVRVRLILRVRM